MPSRDNRLLRFVWSNKWYWLVPILLLLALVLFVLLIPTHEVVPPFVYTLGPFSNAWG